MKNFLKNAPPIIVATLILLNGLVNIISAILPSSLYRKSILFESSRLLQYVAYQRTSMVITIIIGAILLALGIGLYRKHRAAWRWSIIMLVIMSIKNAYPTLEVIQFGFCIFSLLILLTFHKEFSVRQATTKTHIIIAWLTVIFAVAYGTVGCYLMRDQFRGIHSFLDAVYYTLVTYSTVGYGDIIPTTANARLFVITMIFIGLGSFATVITVLLGPVLANKLKKVYTMVEHLNNLEHHAICCGVNNMTRQIAQTFKSKNIDTLFISKQADLLTEMEQLGFSTLLGDATDETVLIKAGIYDANYFVCADGDDAQNILLTMVANTTLTKKPAKQKVKIITVIENSDHAESAKKSGASQLIIPAILASENILNNNTES
ncbi:MAG: NAD-binding protein [Gammaproteobacteria bacterium]|nr:NAD-binding protein [Gammaproteobacteria bacterium]MCH9744451.1 NAD-binding protein [Gammaproteobacteria bacterium]